MADIIKDNVQTYISDLILKEFKFKKEKTMKLTKSGLELKDVIEKAMRDCVITNSEYEEIMKVATKDGNIDDH